PPAGALPDAAAQAAVGRRTRPLSPASRERPPQAPTMDAPASAAGPMKNAVALVSGGMDSAVVLAIAREQGFAVHALSVRNGQRHASERAAAGRVARALGAASHKTVDVDLRSIGGSALTDDIEVPVDGPGDGGIPVTYVPARNTSMLSLALGWA